MRKLLKVSFAFIAFFRPAIVLPSIPSTVLILPFAIIPLFTSWQKILRPIALLRGAAFALLIILAWSFAIDLVNGSLMVMGFRSQFATAVRFLLYVYIAYSLVFSLSATDNDLRSTLLWAVGLQCAIAIVMIADSRVKNFFYVTISGYSGTEKIFRDYFFDVRIFGWSEELFYSAPAMMLAVVILFAQGSSAKWLVQFLVAFAVAILNARISLSALTLLPFRTGGKLVFILPLSAAVVFSLAYFDTFSQNKQALSYYEYLLSDFDSGGSRTLKILLDAHLIFPDGFFDWVFGGGVYVYGEGAPRKSDIGFLIIVNFGGLLYLVAWCSLLGFLIWGSTSSSFGRFGLFLVFSALASKGLIFSGNAMTLLLLVLYFRKVKSREGLELRPTLRTRHHGFLSDRHASP